MFLDKIINDPKFRFKQVMETLHKEFGIEIDFSDKESLADLEKAARDAVKIVKANESFNSQHENPKIVCSYLILEAIKLHKDIGAPVEEKTMAKIETKRVVKEGNEIDKAELLLASKNLVDDLQDMIEKVSKIQVQQLPPIIDRMKIEFGIGQAANYRDQANAALQGIMTAVSTAKESLDNLTMGLSGDVDMAQAGEEPMGAPAAEPEEPMQTPAAKELDKKDEELPHEPSSTSPEGRERKEESKKKSGKILAEDGVKEDLNLAAKTVRKLVKHDKMDFDKAVNKVKGSIVGRGENDAELRKKAKDVLGETEAGQNMGEKMPPELKAWHVQVKSPATNKLFGNYKVWSATPDIAKKKAQDAVMQKHGMTEWDDEYEFTIKPIKESRNDMYEITFVDTGKTFEWTERECIKHFGKEEWNEIRQGYLPHIVAVNLDESKINESTPPGMEGWVKANKAKFTKEYGKRGMEVLYATAWKMYDKKHGKKNETADMKSGLSSFSTNVQANAPTFAMEGKQKVAEMASGGATAAGAVASIPQSLFKKKKVLSRTMEAEQEIDEVSRKHFQMTADTLKHIPDMAKRKELAGHHAEIFSKQNPRFDRAKFMSASGIDEAGCGMAEAKAKLGTGTRFKNVEKSAKKSGAKNPAAVAAAAGIKKYGKKKMAKLAHHESVEEGWDKKNTVNPAKKGMFTGKTMAELEHELATLHKKKEHTAAETTKMRELNFAIRAKKKKHPWGKVKENQIAEAPNSQQTSNASQTLAAKNQEVDTLTYNKPPKQPPMVPKQPHAPLPLSSGASATLGGKRVTVVSDNGTMVNIKDAAGKERMVPKTSLEVIQTQQSEKEPFTAVTQESVNESNKYHIFISNGKEGSKKVGRLVDASSADAAKAKIMKKYPGAKIHGCELAQGVEETVNESRKIEPKQRAHRINRRALKKYDHNDFIDLVHANLGREHAEVAEDCLHGGNYEDHNADHLHKIAEFAKKKGEHNLAYDIKTHFLPEVGAPTPTGHAPVHPDQAAVAKSAPTALSTAASAGPTNNHPTPYRLKVETVSGKKGRKTFVNEAAAKTWLAENGHHLKSVEVEI